MYLSRVVLSYPLVLNYFKLFQKITDVVLLTSMRIELPENNSQLIYKEEDLVRLNIRQNYDLLRSQLYKADERDDCVLIQGAAFVVRGRAFPMLGVGGIDFLDSLAQNPEVDGIIGNGNVLFVARDFSHVYSAHTKEELASCYEYEIGEPTVAKFLDQAPMGSLIFLLRSFKDFNEYEAAKRKLGNVIFEVVDTCSGNPIKFNNQSRLKWKFANTVRVVHCARRPSLESKEALFDSQETVIEALSYYHGHIAPVYTRWSQDLCDAVGMKNTRKLAVGGLRNPTDRITPHLLQMAQASLSG